MERGVAIHCSCLENPMDRGAWQEESMGSQRVTHDWATNTFTFHVEYGPCVLIHWSVCNTVLQYFLGCMANCGYLWTMELYVYNLFPLNCKNHLVCWSFFKKIFQLAVWHLIVIKHRCVHSSPKNLSPKSWGCRDGTVRRTSNMINKNNLFIVAF